MSLKVLYDDHLKGLNIWTYSNKDLELVRYMHTTITFYRHPDTDFIAVYNRKTPLGGNRYTAPSLHPGNMMLQRTKILIPSFKTKPRGSGKIRVVIKPPTLLVDKWYFQKDICDVTLFNLNITAASLRFPFCSPQTNNPCVTFQVLHSVYDKALGINTFGTKETPEDQQMEDIKNWLTKALNTAGFTVLNTFRTEGIYSHPQLKKPPEGSNKPSAEQYFAPLDSLWGDKIYVNNNTSPSQTEATIPGILARNACTYYQKAKTSTLRQHLGAMAHCHLTGIFNPALLTQGRLSPEFFGLYKEIIYNPYDDKGKGNRIWIDPLTKPDNIFDARSKVELEDMPLWMACFGYNDWCKKELNNWGLEVEYRVLLRCPYTYPKLYNDANPNYGYVPISYNFSAGKTVEGDLYVPIMWRTKWYPTMYDQSPVLEDLAMAGPFAPKEKIPSSTLTIKYKAKFIFGAILYLNRLSRTPAPSPPTKFPEAVRSLAEYKSLTRNTSGHTTHSKASTSDVGTLARRVLKECQNNQTLLSLYSQVQKSQGSTKTGTKKQKNTQILDSEKRNRGRARKKQRAKPKKKRYKRQTSSSSCSTSSKSNCSSDGESSASSSN
uniref:Capsid protein n=1 Tax=Torque teno virus TaxID=68887 RepID=Q2F808_9VIRU|nr:ORF1 [Torque teno virus]